MVVVTGTVVVVVVTGTVVVVDVLVVVVVVNGTVVVVGGTVVVVVVAGGITKPLAQPQRISIGAPTLVPTVVEIASRDRRTCAQPSHAETPVVGQPARTWLHAAVCTVMPANRSGIPIANARAARTAHCLAWEPLWV